MDVLVPYAAGDPKTRLAPALQPAERETFARAMLLDVCDALRDAGGRPTVLATAEVECPYDVVVDRRPLTEAVNAHLAAPTAVVMADLPLATADALERLLDRDGGVVLASGLGGGTNALVVRDDDFFVDYHGASVCDHRRIAREAGADLAEVDSFRLAVDVDEPTDLAEVLLHAPEGARARQWLESAGFEPETTDGRVVARR